MPISNNGITIFHDSKSNKDFIMANVTIEKIYWNEIDEYSITEGQSLDIPIPSLFSNWITDANEIMIFMSENSRTFGNISLDDKKIVKGMTYPQYWSTDYLCPIKENKVQFGEYTEEIKASFSRIDDGVYIEEANDTYTEFPFKNNMSVSNLDLYFETIKSDSDDLKNKIKENPNKDYDIAGFLGYQDGVRFRATINYVY